MTARLWNIITFLCFLTTAFSAIVKSAVYWSCATYTYLKFLLKMDSIRWGATFTFLSALVVRVHSSLIFCLVLSMSSSACYSNLGCFRTWYRPRDVFYEAAQRGTYVKYTTTITVNKCSTKLRQRQNEENTLKITQEFCCLTPNAFN